MAIRDLSPRTHLRLLLSSAALALAIAMPAEGPKGTLVIRGVPGQVVLSSDSALSVRNETDGATLRWYVAGAGGAKVPKGLEAFIRPAQGGVAVEIPMGSQPEVVWRPTELTVKWATGGEQSSAASPADLFSVGAAPSYPLGPGDKLQVTVYNVEDMNQAVTVDPGGNITFPVLDKVPVKGLGVNELQKKLEDLLAQFVKNPQVSIQLIEYGSRFVNVLGQVHTPGRIPLKGAFKILDAISQAGGFLDDSGDVEIQRRDASGQLQSRVFTRDELLTGTADRGNIYVLDQDIINVQVVKSVYVNGEVKNPGPFPYNRDMTLLRAITRAGGFTQWANKGRVDILRDEKGVNRVIHVDAGEVEKGKIPDVPLLPNDQVVIRERKFF
jgi:polysaccharide biosynthesis/export protein